MLKYEFQKLVVSGRQAGPEVNRKHCSCWRATSEKIHSLFSAASVSLSGTCVKGTSLTLYTSLLVMT